MGQIKICSIFHVKKANQTSLLFLYLNVRLFDDVGVCPDAVKSGYGAHKEKQTVDPFQLVCVVHEDLHRFFVQISFIELCVPTGKSPYHGRTHHISEKIDKQQNDNG